MCLKTIWLSSPLNYSLNLLHEELLGHKISRKDFKKLSLLLYFVFYFDKEPKYRYSRSIFLYVSRESKEKEKLPDDVIEHY